MKTSILKGIFLLSMFSIAFYACKKDQPEPAPGVTDTQSARDNSIAESAFSSEFDEISDLGIAELGAGKTGTNCVITSSCVFGGTKVITVANCWSSFPDTVTIDFGTGCTGYDGRTRTGILQVIFSDKWRNAGAIATVTPNNYKVDGYARSGVVTFTNINGFDSTCTTNLKMNKKVNANGTSGYAIIETPTGTIQWQCDRTTELVAGCLTDTVYDNVYQRYGTADGINQKGKAFSVNVSQSTPIVKAVSCKWPQDGILEITPQGKSMRSVDFAYPNAQGSGICDAEAEVTVNGNTITFTMQ